MWEIQVAVIAVFAVLGTIRTSVPTIGKCNTTNIVPVPLPMDEIEKHLNWKVQYATDIDSVEDHESYAISVLGGHNYKALVKKVMKDKFRSKFHTDAKYIDNVMIQDFEDNGNRLRVYSYPLEITGSLAMLTYYCSDIGDADVNYRLIVAPEDMLHSEREFQKLLACDKRIFGESHGTLTRLPDKIGDDD